VAAPTCRSFPHPTPNPRAAVASHAVKTNRGETAGIEAARVMYDYL
jgi:hypothetical protein